MWSANGFFWSGNFSMALGRALSSGGSLVLQSTFDAGEALSLMEREKATFLNAWPHQWEQLIGAPGWASGEWLITTGLGSVARYRPALGESDFLAHGFDRLMGIATSDSGAVLFAEMGTGRVHLVEGDAVRPSAEGLDQPMGIALQGHTAYIAEAGAGRIARLRQGSPVDTLAEGLGRPEGLCLSGGKLYAVDTAGKRLLEIDPESGAVATIASNLPVGAPPGVVPKFLGPIGDMSGPMINFADIACGPDGSLYVSADGEGSVLAFRT